MMFGQSIDTSDASFKLVPNPADRETLSFRFYESDNGAIPAFQIQANFDPDDWYNETCLPYNIVMYVPYAGLTRVLCYEFDEGVNLDIGIPRCRNNAIPNNNFYTFRFQVVSQTQL
jgi:hypothetical protein